MKTTLNNLITVRNTLANFADTVVSPRLAYQVAKFIKLTNEDEEFYNTRLRALFDTCAQRNEDGSFRLTENQQGIMLEPEKIEEFNASIFELENVEVDAPDIKFALSDMTKELNMSAKQMMVLMDFIDEEK
jgi:hypothetical protein